MTKNVITVSEETPLSDIAALFEKHRIKRAPVMRSGRVVGIVSRANLIQGLAAKSSTLTPGAADDGTIRLKVIEALKSQPWSHVDSGGVTVTNGVVEFLGGLRDRGGTPCVASSRREHPRRSPYRGSSHAAGAIWRLCLIGFTICPAQTHGIPSASKLRRAAPSAGRE